MDALPTQSLGVADLWSRVLSDGGVHQRPVSGSRGALQIDQLPGAVGREPHDVRRLQAPVRRAEIVDVFQRLEDLQEGRSRHIRTKRRHITA